MIELKMNKFVPCHVIKPSINFHYEIIYICFVIVQKQTFFSFSNKGQKSGTCRSTWLKMNGFFLFTSLTLPKSFIINNLKDDALLELWCGNNEWTDRWTLPSSIPHLAFGGRIKRNLDASNILNTIVTVCNIINLGVSSVFLCGHLLQK